MADKGSIIDAYARRIVGWRASQTAHAGFVLDALQQDVHDRRPVKGAGRVHHSVRGSQYLSIRDTERLGEAGIEPSVGSVGDSYDNALAETINGLFKSEVIHRRGPRGATSKPSNTPPSHGSTGLTTAACSSRSGTSRRRKQRQTSTPLWKLKTWPRT
jgi:transposase InsO family protein